MSNAYVFQAQGYVKRGKNLIQLVDNVEMAENEKEMIKRTKQMYYGFKLVRIKDITREIFAEVK